MKRRRYVEPQGRKVVAGPLVGGVKDALTELAAQIGNSNCTGVAMAVADASGLVTFSVHGEIPAAKLALVAGHFMKWATEVGD